MPKVYEIEGKDYNLYTLGEVAKKIDRQLQTLRKWEREGIIPAAQYRSKTGRRLYTEGQVEVIVRLVEKYGLKQGQAIPEAFKQEVAEAFYQNSIKELEKQEA